MRYYDEYQDLYNSEEDWYYNYVDEELKRLKKKYNRCNHRKQK